ncbi:MAG TPA: fibronectin type III domain-containing protein [Verrucomicrobiae bacterium]|nr:fibronectin type III domain-containing protein [Verrucomicrobiae bacterium]
MCTALMLLAQLPALATQSVTLTWSLSKATNVAGYKIYTGTTSHHYTTTNVTGTATNITITGLAQGQTYYFAATTYDRAGHESVFSSEASYTLRSALGAAKKTGKQFSFTVTGAIGSHYVVQASTNMVRWTSLLTNTAPFTFVETNTAIFSRRYYRAYYLSPLG